MQQPTSASGTSPGLRIATIGGVPVHLGWSWFLLAAVITVLFGGQLADRTSLGYAIGFVYALFLLLAVLVHEGAHAVAARSLGIPVHRVVADFLGGHTAFDATGLTALRAGIIAVAGPIANLALAGLGVVGGAVTTSPVATLVFNGVVWINLLLAAFNLLPALPLDGGQIFESLVWGVTGKRSAGMVAAGWAGRVLTVVIVAWVLVRPLLQGQTPSLVTLVWGGLLASVIWRGASAAIQGGQARRAIDGVTIDSVAQPVHIVPADTPVEAVSIPPGSVLLAGTAPDHLLLITAPDSESAVPPTTPVSALGLRVPPEAVVESAPGSDLIAALAGLHHGGANLVVLTHGGRPWGITTAREVGTLLDRRSS